MCDPYLDTLDVLDEIEALALANEAPTEQKMGPSTPAEETVEDPATNPLVELFWDKQIRILGTVKEPYFCAADVAKYIKDANYTRNLKNYAVSATEQTGAYIITIETKNARGRVDQMLYLTENGLYRYLMRSGLEKALEFQTYVYTIIKAERERVIDSVQLALKIERTRSSELQRMLSQSKRDHRMSKSELIDTMRVANDVRAELKKTKSQLARVQKQQRDGTSARIAEIEEANRTRSWMQSVRLT